MVHAFVFSTRHNAYGVLWTWQCSCGARCRDTLMGAYVTYLPSFVEAAERAEAHLLEADAAVADYAA